MKILVRFEDGAEGFLEKVGNAIYAYKGNSPLDGLVLPGEGKLKCVNKPTGEEAAFVVEAIFRGYEVLGHLDRRL